MKMYSLLNMEMFHVNYVSLPEGICQAHSSIDPCQVFGHIPWIFLHFSPNVSRSNTSPCPWPVLGSSVVHTSIATSKCWGDSSPNPAKVLMARWWQLTYFLLCSPQQIGEMIQFWLTNIFQMGWNHQPDGYFWIIYIFFHDWQVFFW